MSAPRYRPTASHLPLGERRAQILGLLAKGPLTTTEIADEIDVDPIMVGTMLRGYAKTGRVSCGPLLAGQPGRGNRSLRLWALGKVPPAPRGTYASQAKKPKAVQAAKASRLKAPAKLATKVGGRPPMHDADLVTALAAGPLSTAQLAALVGMLPQNAATRLARLVDRGLIVRGPVRPREGRTHPTQLWAVPGAKPAPKQGVGRGAGSQASVRALNDAAWAKAQDKATAAASPAKAPGGETVEQFLARKGRIEVLPPVRYEPPPQQPVGWKQ